MKVITHTTFENPKLQTITAAIVQSLNWYQVAAWEGRIDEINEAEFSGLADLDTAVEMMANLIEAMQYDGDLKIIDAIEGIEESVGY